MPDYANGKIYKLVSPHTDKVYVGSCSHKYLSQRWATHNCDYRHFRNYTKAHDILDCGDCRIELIEKFPCNSAQELHMRENYWLDNTPNCINQNRAYRTPEERKMIQREVAYWRYNNDPDYKAQKRQYYQDHKEACKARTYKSIAKRKLREEYEAKIASM